MDNKTQNSSAQNNNQLHHVVDKVHDPATGSEPVLEYRLLTIVFKSPFSNFFYFNNYIVSMMHEENLGTL